MSMINAHIEVWCDDWFELFYFRANDL